VLVRGVSISFPRYYSPVIPCILLCFSIWLSPIKLQKNIALWIGIVLLAIISFFYWFMLGDWYQKIYLYINGEIGIKPIFTLLVFLILPIAGSFLLLRRQPWFKIAILIIYISQSLSLDFFQARADYSTNYQYGTKGLEKVLTYIAKNIPLSERKKVYFIFYDHYFNKSNVVYSDWTKIQRYTKFEDCIYIIGRKYDFEKKYFITEKQRKSLLCDYKTIAKIDSYIIKKKEF